MPGLTIVVVSGAGDYTGGSRMAHAYGAALARAGHEVVFVTGDRPTDGSTCLADVLIPLGFTVIEESGFYRLRDSGLMTRVARLLASRKADLVISTIQVDLKIVAPAARRCGIPYLVFDQNTHRFYGNFLVRWLKRFAFAREMRGAAGIIAVGGHVGAQAIQEFRCLPEKVVVIPNGIEGAALEHEPPVALHLPPRQTGRLRLLNVGRLDVQKGQHHLIEAIDVCHRQGIDCELLLSGDLTLGNAGSERYAASLRNLTKELGLQDRVHFLGFRSDVASLHRASDMYVHSALWEGPPLPLALMEAMTSGKPTILTDCAGWPEGFEQRTHGMVVKTGDSAALAAAITWVSTLTPPEQEALGRHAKQLIRDRYDLEALGRRFVACCESIVRPGATEAGKAHGAGGAARPI